MMRVPNWRAEFEREIDKRKQTVFEWGDDDCMYGLIVPVINAITGERYFDKYRGKYKTARGALGVIKRSKFDNLADLVASELSEISVSRARIGDVVAIPTDDEFGFALGIVNGDRVFVLHKDAIGTRSLTESKRAFKVG